MATANISIPSRAWTLITNATSSLFALGTTNNSTDWCFALDTSLPSASLIGHSLNPSESIIFSGGTSGQKVYVFNKEESAQLFVVTGAV